MQLFLLDIMLVAAILCACIINCDGNIHPAWTYPGLWYYSALPIVYHRQRQVYGPVVPENIHAVNPYHQRINQNLHSTVVHQNVHSTMVHDRCEPKNWGNLVGKCRMSCNAYDGMCTETLITTDCGCDGRLIVK